MSRLIAVVLGAFACTGTVGSASALEDPTRPPMAADLQSGVATDAPASRLQSVLMSSGRKVAVIAGQTYQLGDRVGDARLVRITETEVVLKSAAGNEVLHLLPGLETARRSAAPAARATGERR